MPDLPITLPFPLIDIAAEGERFRFFCTEIHPTVPDTGTE